MYNPGPEFCATEVPLKPAAEASTPYRCLHHVHDILQDVPLAAPSLAVAQGSLRTDGLRARGSCAGGARARLFPQRGVHVLIWRSERGHLGRLHGLGARLLLDTQQANLARRSAHEEVSMYNAGGAVLGQRSSRGVRQPGQRRRPAFARPLCHRGKVAAGPCLAPALATAGSPHRACRQVVAVGCSRVCARAQRDMSAGRRWGQAGGRGQEAGRPEGGTGCKELRDAAPRRGHLWRLRTRGEEWRCLELRKPR